MDKPLRLMANRFSGCSGWALAPFSAVFGFCCLLCFSAGETQVWLGDLRVVVFCWCLWLCGVLIDLPAPMDICPCTNVFSAYAHVRTEPLARHRPHSRKKNRCLGPVTPRVPLLFVWHIRQQSRVGTIWKPWLCFSISIVILARGHGSG